MSRKLKNRDLRYLNRKHPDRRNRARTCDPRLVRPMLSQLSYPPKTLIPLLFVKGEDRPSAPFRLGNIYYL